MRNSNKKLIVMMLMACIYKVFGEGDSPFTRMLRRVPLGL